MIRLSRLCSGTISGRHERWEFDSGARDLSPEPHTLQKLVEAAAGGTGNMLDLANKVSDSRFSPILIESKMLGLLDRVISGWKFIEKCEKCSSRKLYRGVMARRETAKCELPPPVDWQPSSPAGKTLLLSFLLFGQLIAPLSRRNYT